MSQRFQNSDFGDSLLDLLAGDASQKKVTLASVHRPSFTQQLTFLERPEFTDSQPAALAPLPSRKSTLREIDLPL